MALAASCKNKCVWKCCEMKKLDSIIVKKFGQNVRTQMNIFSSLFLISEQKIYLNEKNHTLLKIGCSPQQFFEVFARFETDSKYSVALTSNELSDLIEFVCTNFDEKKTWKSEYAHISKFKPGMKHVVDLKPTESRLFSLRIGKKYLTIDEEAIYAILRKSSYIKKYILLLEQKRKSCEIMFMQLMSHFCLDNKSLKHQTDFSQSKCYMKLFFEMILNVHCNCIERSFVLEIAANFTEWFSKCIPIYIKTIMLNEVNRLESFSSNEWPHDKKLISVKKLAKSGLFYTGERDVVACAFCNVQLHEWNVDDNPILDHYKYSPKCLFLMDPKRSLNIPIGDDNKIDELLSIIPKENHYDEPDF